MEKIQITQARITPICRNKGDEKALDEALGIIKQRMLNCMKSWKGSEKHFHITAELVGK